MSVSTVRTDFLLILLGCAALSLAVTHQALAQNVEMCDEFGRSSDVFKRLCDIELKLKGKGGSNVEAKRDDASYSLGITFYRTLAKDYPDLSYSDFLTGMFDAADGRVTMSRSDVSRHLKTAFMSRAVRSENYLKMIVENESATAFQGIYYNELFAEIGKEAGTLTALPMQFKNACVTMKGSDCTSTEQNIKKILSSKIGGEIAVVAKSPEQTTDNSANEDPKPASTSNSSDRLCVDGISENTYRVAYARIDPIGSDVNKHLKDMELRCVNVMKTEVIRGWRTVLEKMSENQIWNVIVPSALAYGTKGVEGVEPDETLRFVIALLKKPTLGEKPCIGRVGDC